MHKLDSVIIDIEARIESICTNATSVEEPSLQVALSAYGWVLLDSWIAWRTLRFLLRETYISDSVDEKWYQTPSSYKASQLVPVWNLNDSVFSYVKLKTNRSFKDIIDNTIQAKRNSCAHYSRKQEINGTDIQDIKKLFMLFSKVFLLQENVSFQKKLSTALLNEGYKDICISFSDGSDCTVEDFESSINVFSSSTAYFLICNKDCEEYIIRFEEDGCRAGYRTAKDTESRLVDVINGRGKGYCFLKNKGFYLDFDMFFDSIITCWKH